MINALQERVPQLDHSPCINVSFSVAGKQLPTDHGYLVYSAISRATQRGSSPSVTEGVNTGSAGVSPARSPLHKSDWLGVCRNNV